VLLKIQFMSVDNYYKKKFQGRHFLGWNSQFLYMILHATLLA